MNSKEFFSTLRHGREMTVDFYAYSGLVNGITSLFLAAFLLRKSAQSEVVRTFSYFCFAVAFWGINYFFWLKADSREKAELFIRLTMVGAVFIPILFSSFTARFLNIQEKKITLLNFTACFLLMLFSFSHLFIRTLEKKHIFQYWPSPGPVFHLMLVYFLANALAAHILLAKEAMVQKGVRRNQILGVFFGTLIGFIGGSTNYLLWYDIPVPPVLNILVSVYVLSVGYAIMKFKLLDIELIVRKTVIFAGLLAFVFAVFSAATFLVQVFLSRFFGAGNAWTYGISLFLIVLGYDPIRNFLVNLTDKYLFQKKYDYQKILKDATRGMSKIESLDHLLGLVVHFITMKMRVRNTAIMMRRRDNEFELGFQRGYTRSFLDYRLDDTNPMIQYLLHEKEAVAAETVKEYIEAGNKKRVKGEAPHEYDFQAVLLTMEELQAAAVIPSFLGHDLRSVLVVGEKKSGGYFTPDDLNLLYTLAQESAIAIENAKLFDEAINKSNQLAKINEQLEYSRNLLMKALRETEIANKQLQDTQAQLIHEQKMATLGRLAASVGHEVNNPLTILSMNVSRAILKYRKNPDLRVAEVLELFQKMEQNIGRIKAVVNTLTGLLKKSEKGKFEPLSLKLILEETLPLVQFQTYLDNLSGTEVEFDIPGNTPLIRGDLERLQEVFLNLFINAYHAMTGRRNRRIRVTAEVDSENAERVAVNFTDNGCGMTEEIMKKIFNYGFTTKPPGRGSGMGLYMCKYIVELHGGEMRVKSKVGEGTTFTIFLPAYEESGGETGGLRIEATS